MKKPEIRSPYMNPQQGPAVKKITREEAMKKIADARERDEEIVTGIFKNLENPARDGGRGAVCFGFKKYPNQAYTFYELWDGERYALPRMVAHHLNNDCYYKEYQHLPGEFGEQGIRHASPQAADGRMVAQTKQMSKRIHRYAFHSLEYMDDDPDMYPSKLVEVTFSP